jgi:hypothetical protein
MEEFFNRTRWRGHMASETLQILSDNNIEVMDWSSKGADMSLIGTCFGAEMQRRAKAKFSEFENKN